MDRQTPIATSVAGFCRNHGISRAHFYNLIKRGQGPVVLKVGRRTLISAEAAAAWRRRMEKPAMPALIREGSR
jgi:predicted DNA-binding transcriptional regulator AlpA